MLSWERCGVLMSAFVIQVLFAEKYVMSEEQQAVIFLRLRKERAAIKNEMAALEADMKSTGEKFSQLGNILVKRTDIATQSWEMAQQDLAEMSKKAPRYVELQGKLVEKESELAKFGEPFQDK
jgi:hypothetical protein